MYYRLGEFEFRLIKPLATSFYQLMVWGSGTFPAEGLFSLCLSFFLHL